MEEKDIKANILLHEAELGRAIRMVRKENIGVLDSQFLSQPISVLSPRTPICVTPEVSLGAVIKKFNDKNISSLVIVDDQGKLAGIFTERDCVRKALEHYDTNKDRPISDFMTKDPVAQTLDISIAYALNVMSQGGFRHIPLVDDDNNPIGILSIRDVMTYIVSSLVDDLLNFDTTQI